jgi:hypothetical protein
LSALDHQQCPAERSFRIPPVVFYSGAATRFGFPLFLVVFFGDACTLLKTPTTRNRKSVRLDWIETAVAESVHAVVTYARFGVEIEKFCRLCIGDIAVTSFGPR